MRITTWLAFLTLVAQALLGAAPAHAAFTPAVNPLVVTCLAPTSNTDGSPLVASDLSRYTVEYSSCASANVISTPVLGTFNTPNAAVCGATLPNLAPRTYCVRMTATRTDGVVSDYSNTASGVVAAVPSKPNPPSNVSVTVNTVAYVLRKRWFRVADLRPVPGVEIPLGLACGKPVRGHRGYNYLPNVVIPTKGVAIGQCSAVNDEPNA